MGFNSVMNFIWSVLLVGSIAPNVTTSESIQFKPTYFSSPTMDTENSNVFSSYFDASSHISTYSNLQECEENCKNQVDCLGIVETQEPATQCLLVNALGQAQQTDITSISFTKYTSYDNRDKHTITGRYYYGEPEYGEDVTHTVYVDVNHNGIWDANEPINTTINNAFELTNISEGNYLVREIQDDECIQLWPGVWGDSVIESYNSDSYVDSVVQYYHDGHPTQATFNGGVIIDASSDTVMTVPGAAFSMILGNSPATFLSFKTNYGIALAFLNEVIEDGEGSDLIIETYGNSSTNARVSVSHNNIDYVNVGVLTDSVTKFDFADVNHTIHVAFVKLDFFNTNISSNEERNIVSVRGVSTSSSYSPPFAAYTTVPQVDDVIFIKDCHYYYHCYTYCVYTRQTFDEIDSCMVGCDLWEETGTCMCQDYNTTGVPFYGDDYKKIDCDDGCTYRIKHEVHPEYDVKMHASGRPESITSSINCQEYDVTGLSPNGCILDAIDSCSRQPACEAISLDNHIDGFLYNDYHYLDEENSYFIVKNSEYRNRSLVRHTTPTTTQTTSGSSSATSTPTLSGTTSVTSTPSSSLTSSATTTATSTTQTTSPTTTSTPTTSVTTSVTTTTLIEESQTANAVRDGVLIALAVIAVIILIYIAYKLNRRSKQMPPRDNNGDLTSTSQPFSNPVYDGRPGYAFSSNPSSPVSLGGPVYLDVSANNPNANYMDVVADNFSEGPPSVSPTTFRTKSPIQQSSSV